MENDRQHLLAIRLLLIAAVLGILGDLFLQSRPWGLGVPIFAVSILAACILARRFGGAGLSRSATALGLTALPFAALFAWRDADGLRLLNGLVLVLVVGMFVLRAQLGAVYATTLSDLLLKGPYQWLRLASDGSVLAWSDVKWKRLAERNGARRY